MKKIFILFVLFIMACSLSAISQTQLIYAGFNGSSMPTGWATQSVFGNEGVVSIVNNHRLTDYASGNGTEEVIYPKEGSHMVMFNSDQCPDSHSARLESPSVSTINYTNLKVSFAWLRSGAWDTHVDSVVIQYSIDNKNTWVDVNGIGRREYGHNKDWHEWREYTFDIPANAANIENVCIGFLFIGDGGTNCFLDSVVVTGSSGSSSLSITPPAKDVSAIAGNTNYTITSATAWTATSDQTWCTVTPSGDGSGTLTTTYEANTVIASRTATITVTAGSETATATLTQGAADAILSIDPTYKNVPATAGNFNVSVTSNTAWTATSNKSWLTLDVTGGSNNGAVTATYTENTDVTPRSGVIVFKTTGQDDIVFNFTQEGAGETSISITPSTQNVAAAAGSFDYTITSATAWTATSDQVWCTVTPSGAGSGTLTATYEANTGSMRTAIITATTADGKVATATLTQEEFVGIEDVNAQIFVYPNPSEGIFNIVLDGNSYNMVVVDILGNVVHKNTFSNNYKLNMSNNAAGTYFVKIVSAEKTLTQKIVLK